MTPSTSEEIAARGALLDFYSDRAVAFGGFFIASIFGLLTVLTLAQGIDCANKTWETVLVGLSLIAYGVFAYIGYYVLRGFYSYAKIADRLESGGGDTESLRYEAHLGKATWDCIESEDRKRKRMLGKIASDIKWFRIAYLLLLIVLAIIAYGSRF